MGCLDYALQYIHRYPKTEKDLTIKLFQKGYSSDDVHKTLEYLKRKEYLNDKIYAEMYINSEVIKKGKPLFLIIKKLQEKGVEKDILNKIIKSQEEEITEGIHERIKKEIQICKRKNIDGFDIIQRLMRRGYKLQDIKDVIKSNNQ